LNIARILLIFLATLVVGGCDLLTIMPLERKYTNLNVEEMRSGSSVKLKISGSVFHSAMVVKRIRKEETPSELHIIVEIVFTREGLSSYFEEEIILPDTVETVSFGEEKVTIWTRKAGVIEHPIKPTL
jgi:hypothetical protein